MLDFVRLMILLAVPVLLFSRPKFIRDYFGEIMPIILGLVSIAAIIVQALLFNEWRNA